MCLNMYIYATVLLKQLLLCPLCQHSLFLISCSVCYEESVDATGDGIEVFTHYNFSNLQPYLSQPPTAQTHFNHLIHFCTKNTSFLSGAQSTTSHIKHTPERDPHTTTRGPALSLYKSNCSKLPRKPGPEKESLELLWNDIRSRGLGWGRGLWEVHPLRFDVGFPQSLRSPMCDCPGWVNWKFPEHEALMRAW